MTRPLSVEMALRATAGFFVLASLGLGWLVHPGFLLFTAFVGLNLLQSGFTDRCPMMALYRKLGVADAACTRHGAASGKAGR